MTPAEPSIAADPLIRAQDEQWIAPRPAHGLARPGRTIGAVSGRYIHILGIIRTETAADRQADEIRRLTRRKVPAVIAGAGEEEEGGRGRCLLGFEQRTVAVELDGALVHEDVVLSCSARTPFIPCRTIDTRID